MTTITINNKKYNLKYSVRAMMMFEQVKCEMFSLKLLSDQYLFLYCLILAGDNKDNDLTFDKLLDAIDKDPSIFSQYAKFMELETARQREMQDKNDKQEGDTGKN